MSKNATVPEGYNTVNPFIITDKSAELLNFIVKVFDGQEQEEALTYDEDELVLHSEVKIGNSMVMLADRKPEWPVTPSLLQVYVADVEKVLERAESLGAKVVTNPTEYIGVKFSRFIDTHGNLWWVYQQLQNYDWEAAFGDEAGEDSWKPTPEAKYIHDTLIEAMKKLEKS